MTAVLCDMCGQAPATVHMTQVMNDEKRELRLCVDCAGKEAAETGMSWPGPSFHKLLGGLLGSESALGGLAAAHGGGGLRCPNCGLTFSDFRRLGHLGCSQCYPTFAELLEPVLRRIQVSTVHAGKIPAKAGGTLKLRRQRERLEQELQRLIEKEAYEQAAIVRDKIRALERGRLNGRSEARAGGASSVRTYESGGYTSRDGHDRPRGSVRPDGQGSQGG